MEGGGVGSCWGLIEVVDDHFSTGNKATFDGRSKWKVFDGEGELKVFDGRSKWKVFDEEGAVDIKSAGFDAGRGDLEFSMGADVFVFEEEDCMNIVLESVEGSDFGESDCKEFE